MGRSQVRKKYLKNYPAEVIADMLEQDISTVTGIIDYIREYPDFTDMMIYKKLAL